MNVILVTVLCPSSTFMGQLHFCPGDIPFLIQTPPLRMTDGVGGGGAVIRQIFQRCQHAKNEPFGFHFSKGRNKNLKIQFLVILRGVGVPCG